MKDIENIIKNIKDEGIDLDTFDKETEIAKFDSIIPQGWTIATLLYTKSSLSQYGIILTSKTHEEQQYSSNIALVIKKAKGVYNDERYKDTGPWCETGDWVIFRKHSGYKLIFEGKPLYMIKEDVVDVVIDDPRKFFTNKKDEGIDLDTFDKEAEIAKFDGIEAKGWTIVIRLFIEPETTKGGIWKPSLTRETEQHKVCAGLVIKKSKDAYRDDRYKNTGSWCEVGQWVVFPRHAGYAHNYDGMSIFIVDEDAIDLVIEDPRTLKR